MSTLPPKIVHFLASAEKSVFFRIPAATAPPCASLRADSGRGRCLLVSELLMKRQKGILPFLRFSQC
ncbi:hypothetical protein, partial [uncultured Desulfovibrio sp.]|uniref:hypothetical protein n=1 Tax=uncultured Desulfovibrio sp. TaxID=167968 RepID=UPI00262B184D